jgi:hypothetical protein
MSVNEQGNGQGKPDQIVRKTTEWRDIGIVVIIFLLIVNLIATPFIVYKITSNGNDFLKEQAKELGETQKTIRDGMVATQQDIHSSLAPVGPAITKVGDLSNEAALSIRFARVHNLAALEIDQTELSKLLSHADTSLNDPKTGVLVLAAGTLKNMRDLANKFGVTVDQLATSIIAIQGSVTTATEQMRKVFADDRINKLLDELKATSGNITAISESAKAIFANFAEASKLAPGIAITWKKIMDTGHKLQIPLAIAQFIGLVAPVLKPIFGIGP